MMPIRAEGRRDRRNTVAITPAVNDFFSAEHSRQVRQSQKQGDDLHLDLVNGAA